MESTRRAAPSRNRIATLALAAVALLAADGCSFSKSSESISNSISSPFKSISGSSQTDASRYREEVAEYSAAFVKAGGGSSDSFKKGISKLAARRGISDWESNADTWDQVGRGLARTDLSEAEALAYATAWTDGDGARMELVRQGFLAGR
jgi:hypothetical protein